MNEKRPRRKRKGARSESCTYCLEILDWELPYSLSINSTKRIAEGPYWEHTSLKIKGKLIYPERLADNIIEVTILGDRRLIPVLSAPEKYDQYLPKAVGFLTIRGRERELICSIPFDVICNIGILMHAGQIKFLVIDGHPLYRGATDIRSINFSKDFVLEDWV